MSDPRASLPRVRSKFSDDPDYRDLLEMFEASLQEATGGLRDAFGAGDVAQLQREAHRLKGAGGGYGFDELTPAAHSLEEACMTRDMVQIQQTLDRLLDYISRIEI
jgi:HPt (histidine-containing phosphotransfer) domain-containing protein